MFGSNMLLQLCGQKKTVLLVLPPPVDEWRVIEEICPRHQASLGVATQAQAVGSASADLLSSMQGDRLLIRVDSFKEDKVTGGSFLDS